MKPRSIRRRIVIAVFVLLLAVPLNERRGYSQGQTTTVGRIGNPGPSMPTISVPPQSS